MSILQNKTNAKPCNSSGQSFSTQNELIEKLEEIFESPSYNCLYKSRVQARRISQLNQSDRQQRLDLIDLQDIYLKYCPKARLFLCLSFEKFVSLTIKYFKVFSPSKRSVYSYDIFLEIKGQKDQIMGEIYAIKDSLEKLVNFQRCRDCIPFRKVYLQISYQMCPSNIREQSKEIIVQSINEYSYQRQQILDILYPIFEEIPPINFKSQFCMDLQLDQQKQLEISNGSTPASIIIDLIMNLKEQTKEQFPCDKITINPQQFFEESFYERNESFINESLNQCNQFVIKILTFNEYCAQFMSYSPIKIYYDLFEE